MMEEIQKELLNLGYNPTHIGTTYLAYAIYMLSISDISIEHINLEKDIYTKLSSKYNKNNRTIKSNIIKATNCINPQNSYMVNKYHMSISKGMKLTPKLVIWLILNNLKSKNK